MNCVIDIVIDNLHFMLQYEVKFSLQCIEKWSEAGDWEVMGTIKGLLGSPNSLLHALKSGGGNTAKYLEVGISRTKSSITTKTLAFFIGPTQYFSPSLFLALLSWSPLFLFFTLEV